MGKGSKTTRGMNVLVKTIIRKRMLKHAAPKTFARPEGIGSAPQIIESKSAE
ncbi:MAG: hypothetical protein ACXWW0_03070 [Bacteroidia bacterium]